LADLFVLLSGPGYDFGHHSFLVSIGITHLPLKSPKFDLGAKDLKIVISEASESFLTLLYRDYNTLLESRVHFPLAASSQHTILQSMATNDTAEDNTYGWKFIIP
jgi:hypothetical protein